MDSQSQRTAPLVAFNTRRKVIIILNSIRPYQLSFKDDTGIKVVNNELDLMFNPTAIYSHGDFLLIQGRDCVFALNLDTELLFPIGKPGREILDLGLHPLSDRAIGILTSDRVLSIYTLPNENCDISVNLFRHSPISFTFFSEHPKTLFSFGVCVLTTTGQLFVISPMLPKSFKLTKEVLKFRQICQIEGNSYVIYERKLGEWLERLEKCVESQSRNWKKLTIQNFSDEKPVPRGPCFEAKDKCFKVRVVNSCNPSVLAIQTRTHVKIVIATGDLIPSFSEGKPSVEWELLEEISLPEGTLLHAGENLICTSDYDLIRIELPWLPIVKESYLLRKQAKSLPRSQISIIRENVKVNHSCIAFSHLTQILCFATDSEVFYESESGSRAQEELIFIDRADLVPEFQMPGITLPRLEPILNAIKEVPRFEGEEKEVFQLVEVFNKTLMQQGVPLCERFESSKKVLEDCQKRNEVLNRNYEGLNEKIKQIENYHNRMVEKIKMVSENDLRIRNRIKDIIEIQQNTKKPLTQTERELSQKLSALENDSNVLKLEFQKALQDLTATQLKLRSLSTSYPPDPQLTEELQSYSFQLGEVSSEICKFKQPSLLNLS